MRLSAQLSPQLKHEQHHDQHQHRMGVTDDTDPPMPLVRSYTFEKPVVVGWCAHPSGTACYPLRG